MAKKFFLRILFVAVIAADCKQKYEPPAIQKGITALVVDGFINNSPDTTFIYLSHANKLSEGTGNAQEQGARLSIEDSAGGTLYNFQEINDSGTYIVPGINLDINKKYRLRIITGNGKQYLSDAIAVIKTPPIDSITFEKTISGVTIHANTHDPLNNTRYYRWKYTETWHYRARFFSALIYNPITKLIEDRPPQKYIYDCWKTQNSTQLLLATSANLSEDIIYHNPVRQIDQDAVELSDRYFIFLRQYALSKEYYEYLQNLKKITEQTGSIFDAQPSQLTGNIHAVGDTSQIVLGYLTASTEELKQLYITNAEVLPWFYSIGCTEIKVPIAMIELYFGKQGLIPIMRQGFGLSEVITGSDRPCVDCTFLGGVTTKPGFWP